MVTRTSIKERPRDDVIYSSLKSVNIVVVTNVSQGSSVRECSSLPPSHVLLSFLSGPDLSPETVNRHVRRGSQKGQIRRHWLLGRRKERVVLLRDEDLSSPQKTTRSLTLVSPLNPTPPWTHSDLPTVPPNHPDLHPFHPTSPLSPYLPPFNS